MSVTRITSIHCDGCGAWSYGNGISTDGTANSIRAGLRRRGWLIKRGLDLCPDCVKSHTSPGAAGPHEWEPT